MALHVVDKWDDYTLENEDGDEAAALDLLTLRVDDGWWYHGVDASRAMEIVQNKNGRAALGFLLSRAEHEYEFVERRESTSLGTSTRT